jgi:hypothetical protein
MYCWRMAGSGGSALATHRPQLTPLRYMTLGIADVSTYDILGTNVCSNVWWNACTQITAQGYRMSRLCTGNPSSNFMLFVVHQLLFVFMGVMIGTAIKLLVGARAHTNVQMRKDRTGMETCRCGNTKRCLECLTLDFYCFLR